MAFYEFIRFGKGTANTMTLAAADLNPKQFQKISDMVYRTAGINLKEGKEALVRARLMKRLRFLGMSRVEDYIEFIDSDEVLSQVEGGTMDFLGLKQVDLGELVSRTMESVNQATQF